MFPMGLGHIDLELPEDLSQYRGHFVNEVATSAAEIFTARSSPLLQLGPDSRVPILSLDTWAS